MLGKIKDILKIILRTRNFPSVLWSLAFGEDAEAVFRNGQVFPFAAPAFERLMNYVNFFWNFPTGMIRGTVAEIRYQERTVQLDFGWLGPYVLTESFTEEHNIYGKLLAGTPVAGRTVIDIGAAFGDTPVWFAFMGAKKVVAIEPVPSLADLTATNIRLNRLEGTCDLLRAGVSGEAHADIHEDKEFAVVLGGYDTLAREFTPKTPIPLVTLSDLVKKYDVNDGIVKLDCEGWEYEILLNTPREVLRKFSCVVMEYHYGYERLEKKLTECGFSVTHGEAAAVHVTERPEGHQDMAIGYLCATRIAP